jgi:hypothetical protein
VHFSVKAQPLSARRPLDVDRDLPLPEVGQASTVFSLTALFGAYFGIYLFLGIPALAGVACGTIVGLFVLRTWMQAPEFRSFEDFLLNVIGDSKGNGATLAIVLAAAQCAYAASELLIFRQISGLALGMRPDHATLLAVATGIIGYFYVLFGGYMAVYRTDVLQFALVALMVLFFGLYFLTSGISIPHNFSIWPRANYWTLPFIGSSAGFLRYIYHFAVGTIMGFGLLAAAPDAWKRVFVVTTLRQRTIVRFAIFVAVGVGPFLALLPLGLLMAPIPDGPIDAQQIFSNFPTGNLLFVGISLGLIACLLSSFNSALLASVHVGLILRRTQRGIQTELPRFHWLMATVLVTIFLFYMGLFSFENPYLLGNLLLGPYAIIAGIQAGTRATPGRLPTNGVLWVAVLSFAIWVVYFSSVVGLPTTPTTYEVNTVPGGAIMFLIIAVTCKILSVGKEQND